MPPVAAVSVFLPLVCDLDRLWLPREAFQAMIMIRYLDLDLVQRLQSSVCTGGVFFVLTFNQHHLLQRPDFNPDFVLNTGDLERVFGAWEIVCSEEKTEGWSYVTARKPG